MSEKTIRNVAVLGHQGSGKTSLVEALYSVAAERPKGSVERKNTVSDYLAEEQNRLGSVRLSVVPVDTENCTINLIDIPGNDDFIGEAISAVHVVKGAILVMDASSGVEVETIKHWNLLRKKNIPTIIFVNKMDKENVIFDHILSEIREKLGKNAIPFCYPMGHNDDFDGFVNVVTLKARKYNGHDCEDAEIYDDKKLKVFELNNMMVEAVAQTSEELLDKFFMGEALTQEEIQKGLRSGVLAGELIPVLVGCATKNIGIHTTLKMLEDYLPNPSDLNPIIGYDASSNEVPRKTLNDEPFSAFVFKTYVDSYSGTTSIFKVNSGVLTAGDEVLISNTNKTFTAGQLFKICGNKQTAVRKLMAGEIGVINKIEGLETSMTLCSPKNFIKYPEIEFPGAVYFKSLEAKSKSDVDKLGSVLAKMMLEDKSLEVRRNIETNQLLLGTLGVGHLTYILERMKNAYKLDVSTSEYKVVYRETIKTSAHGTGRYIKQSGGSGFYGVVEMDFSPAKENTFTEEVFGGTVPKNYFPAVEKGFNEACEKGLLAGFPVIGIHACLKDGKYHAVDSNELSFKMASILAFKDAYLKCKPVILEPILQVTITVHSDDVGTILSDLNSRRGRITGMEINSVKDQKITALVPEREILEYVNDLKSMTQGSGYFYQQFFNYEEAPNHIQEKILKETQ
ncbi:MAG: elongation factor G [Anaeroplasmataceae bacterium]|nr:elongation factor G [Anaeroplasmataceae bacterium]MDE7384926.1 elongation factor G [Anaeroplasmataceae bacterium]